MKNASSGTDFRARVGNANLCRARLQPCRKVCRIDSALQASEKAIYFVIPNEVRNLSSVVTHEKSDSSARSAPRNDKKLSFSAVCLAAGLIGGAR